MNLLSNARKVYSNANVNYLLNVTRVHTAVVSLAWRLMVADAFIVKSAF